MSFELPQHGPILDFYFFLSANLYLGERLIMKFACIGWFFSPYDYKKVGPILPSCRKSTERSEEGGNLCKVQKQSMGPPINPIGLKGQQEARIMSMDFPHASIWFYMGLIQTLMK